MTTTDPNRGEDGGNTAPWFGFRWYHVYFLLAAFDLIIICCSVGLTHHLLQVYEHSVEHNQSWAERQTRYIQLTQLIARLDAPITDVLESGELERQSQRLAAREQRLDAALRDAWTELDQVEYLDTSSPRNHLGTVLEQSARIAAHARQVFAHLERGEQERAGDRRALMRQQADLAVDTIHQLCGETARIQQQLFAQEEQDAALISRLGTLMGGAIVAMVVGVTIYGHRLAANMALAESQVQDSEARALAVLDTAADAIVSIDDRGLITAFNSSAERIFGYRAEEVFGKNVSMLMPSPFAEQHDQYLKSYLEGRPPTVIGIGREALGRRRDRTVFPLELSVGEVVVGDTRTFTGIVRDISDRKNAEDRIRHAHALLNTVTRAQTMAIADNDPRSLFHDLLEAVLDLTSSEFGFIGEVRYDGDQPYLKTYSITNIAWDQETRDFFDRGAPTGLEFRNLNTLFGQVLTTHAPVISNDPASDPRSGGTPPGHPKLESFLGLPFHRGRDLVGMVGVANCPVGYQEELVEFLTPLTSACGQIIDGIRMDRQRKQTLELLASNAEQLEEQKSELQELNARLSHSNNELSQFAYVASHDLQEPLRKIASFCQLLKEEYASHLDEEGNTYIDFAVDGAKRMKTLIADLLDYSRVESRGKPLEPSCPDHALKLALDNLQHAIEDRQALVRWSDPFPKILADKSQLVQLFQNLVGNAVKYNDAEVPTVEISCRRDGDECTFAVCDNGIGIDPQFQERIFVIFQRLHRRTEYSGTGIGLAVCKKIVERMHGRMWVEPNPDGGSTFCFTAHLATGGRQRGQESHEPVVGVKQDS